MDSITPIAYFRSPFTSKFGLPRQSGILEELEGEVVFQKPYDHPDAVRGLEGFEYIWLIWRTKETMGERVADYILAKYSKGSLTVRPPRLGGNVRVGVFASRSPFRPNGICLSCVRLKEVRDGRLIVLGADLMNGTPILDVKPYVPFTDAHPNARSGFTDTTKWNELVVDFPEDLRKGFTDADVRIIIAALSQDPRPHYHDDPERIYGMPYAGRDIKFKVADGKAFVVAIE